MTAQHWIITVDDEHFEAMDEVVTGLESSGLIIDKVLRSLGQITGHTEQDGDLAAVPGVAFVGRSKRHRIAPPDAEVQ